MEIMIFLFLIFISIIIVSITITKLIEIFDKKYFFLTSNGLKKCSKCKFLLETDKDKSYNVCYLNIKKISKDKCEKLYCKDFVNNNNNEILENKKIESKSKKIKFEDYKKDKELINTTDALAYFVNTIYFIKQLGGIQYDIRGEKYILGGEYSSNNYLSAFFKFHELKYELVLNLGSNRVYLKRISSSNIMDLSEEQRQLLFDFDNELKKYMEDINVNKEFKFYKHPNLLPKDELTYSNYGIHLNFEPHEGYNFYYLIVNQNGNKIRLEKDDLLWIYNVLQKLTKPIYFTIYQQIYKNNSYFNNKK